MSLLRSPWRVLAILALLAAGLWAARTIRLETDVLALMPPELPSVRGSSEFQRRFASKREVVVIADPAMPEAERAAIFRVLRPALAAVPGVVGVAAPGEEIGAHWPEAAAWILWNQPPEAFARALAALGPEQARARLAALPEALAGSLDPAELGRLQLDPLGLLETLGAGEGAAGSGFLESMAPTDAAPPFLLVRAGTPLAGFEECIPFVDAIRAAMERALPGEQRVLLTGQPAFTAEIARQMRGDMALMLGVASVLVCGLFWVFYRTLRPLGWILFFQALALLAGVVVARVCFGSLNLISMGFASILLGVSMDYSILVYHHFATGHGENAAVWARLRRGIWFSAATTAAAFLVLAWSSFPGLRQLAALVAAGLLASALFATWLLRGVLANRPPAAPPVLARVADAAAGAVVRWRRVWLVAAFAMAALAAVLVARQPAAFFSADMRQFQPTASAAWQAQQWLMSRHAAEADAIFLVRAPTWEAVRHAAAALAAQVSEGRTTFWAHLLPAPAHQATNRAAWNPGVPARLRTEFEAAGFGEEWSGPTLTVATALERAAAGDGTAFQKVAPLLATIGSEKDGSIDAIIRLPGSAGRPLPPDGLRVTGAEVLPVSWVVMSAEITTLARRDMTHLGGWMLAALALLCALAQRSARLVALNFAALSFALLALALLLAATGTALSPLSLLAIPLLLGLVIDYSLHVLMALEHSDGDVRTTFRHLAAPVVLTGLASCIGFGAPMLTRQPALRNFGLVMDLGILAAVGTCLVLLPLLYRAFSPRRGV